jgi:enoyl-CoA hydratase
MTTADGLSVTRRGAVLRVELARPEKANALSAGMVEALHALLDEAYAEDTSALVFEAQGANFCAGFDLSELDSCSEGDLALRFIRIEWLLQRIHHAPFETAALAQGKAYGAGADLLCACDRRIADTTTEFRFPGPLFGLVLGAGRLAARVGPEEAQRLLGGASPMPGDRALRCGLVSELAPRSTWPDILEGLPGPRIERGTFAALRARTTPDSRAADMMALVQSAARPGIRSRLIDYRSKIARRGRI